MGGLSLRLEEVYVLQSTGGSGLCERLMVIVGWGCEGPSCIFTSCCTGGPGGFRKLPGLWATHQGPPEKAEERKVQFLFIKLIVPPSHALKFCLFLLKGTRAYSGSPSFYKGVPGDTIWSGNPTSGFVLPICNFNSNYVLIRGYLAY